MQRVDCYSRKNNESIVMAYFLNCATVLAFGAVLTACGGGNGGAGNLDDNQQITTVQARTLSYSQQAVIVVGGFDLRNTMSAVTGVCKNPVFNEAQSAPQLAIINCLVTATGEQPLTILGSNGKVLYSGTVAVPLPQVAVVTSEGSITLELNPVAAPISVDNFLAYVKVGFYRDTLFHRVIANFVAQAGGYTSGIVKKPGQRAPIALESNNGLLNTRSTLAMARTNVPNSATSEFYINLIDNAFLDYKSDANPGYAVFGKVIKGMDVVDKIAALPTATSNGFANVPLVDVKIQLVLQIQ